MFWTVTTMLLILSLIIATYAEINVRHTFKKFSQIDNRYGYTAEEIARKILDSMNLYDVEIEKINGNLTDHYDPKAKVLRLSESVYGSTSMAAIGVAAHEAGHAIQHAKNYMPLEVRNNFFPIAKLGSNLSYPLIFLGLILGSSGTVLINLGIVFFTMAVLFQVITLPVEFNASNRAIALLQSNALFSEEDIKPAQKVLRAAALTYVAATLVSILQLIRLILIGKRKK
ncbi:zinc metallopeptidase [Thermoanaerobacterium thermosaccharolyticum]|uniref:zinc metallopeptidase n=1 Tax=Thermoanaerobacterium thermosaccharolyticum TaxID=1517 RepID=UPI0017813EE8|nr:zinc metallopeptidase [Thermoanaerobacterium thermosaccharolyticum]MBE0069851.1 zinc metallopeptidase [Thermoanaerobacterium thermosaccharolyticum]MBE0227484.1 zinc metallopeptidase [Thermoanaerobacterium thermosaccharolyticum]